MKRETRLDGLRVVWVSLVVFTAALFIIAIPQRFAQLRTPTPTGDDALVILSLTEAALLQQHGIPITAYAGYFIALETIFAAIFALIGIAIVLRKPDEPLAFFASATLVTFGVLIPGTIRVLDIPASSFELPVHLIQVIGWISFFTCLYVFPDGRFVPRAMRLILIPFGIWGIAWIFIPAANAFNWDLPHALLAFGAVFASGVLVQGYRYRYISNHVERLQTRWVVLGFAAAAVGTFAFLIPPLAMPPLRESGLPRVAFHIVGITVFAISILLMPLSLDFAIRRYRLWAIDPIINRALVYVSVTATLVLVYAVSIIVLQSLAYALMGNYRSGIAAVVSTLLIAALFNPLRARIQNVIDRRFYRRKYDAARALEAFGASLRSQVDLEHLTDDMLRIVEDTMQPAHQSVWLAKAQQESKGSAAPHLR